MIRICERRGQDRAPVFDLSTPIIVHGQETSRLVLDGNPSLGDLAVTRIKIGAARFRFNISDVPHLIAPLARIPPAAAAKISVRDLAALGPVIADFLGNRR